MLKYRTAISRSWVLVSIGLVYSCTPSLLGAQNRYETNSANQITFMVISHFGIVFQPGFNSEMSSLTKILKHKYKNITRPNLTIMYSLRNQSRFVRLLLTLQTEQTSATHFVQLSSPMRKQPPVNRNRPANTARTELSGRDLHLKNPNNGAVSLSRQ